VNFILINKNPIVMKEDLQVYLFLFIGSLCMFLASLLAGNVEWVPGTTSTSFYGTLFVSFVLIVIAGIFWISSAKLLRPVKHMHSQE